MKIPIGARNALRLARKGFSGAFVAIAQDAVTLWRHGEVCDVR